MIILIRQVKNAHCDFGVLIPETIAGVNVFLNEIVAGHRGGITGVVLVIPGSIRARKEA